MRVTRLYLPENLASGAQLMLPDAAARHVSRVLRLSTGAALRVFDGRGHEFEAVIASDARDRVEVRLGAPVLNDSQSPLRITLLQGVARGEKMDLILQKATELGVTAIRPLLMTRSTVKLDAAGIAKRHAHWQGVIIAACEQSGRATLPDLTPATSLQTALAHRRDELQLLLAPEAGSPALPTLLQAHPITALRGIRILIGPEGGFDDDEAAQALNAGFQRCRLGPRILRTETAALAAIAALQVLTGDWLDPDFAGLMALRGSGGVADGYDPKSPALSK
jgi:16S rRNA (uracil1498-N3)-methyltransferase